MDSFFEGVLKRVSWRERCKIRKHNVFEVYRLKHRTEHRRTLFNLRRDEQENADYREPIIPPTCGHECDRKTPADAYCAAGGADGIHGSAEDCTQNTSAVHWICRQEIK